MCVRRFESGLRPSIKDRMAASDIHTYPKIVETAIRVESSLENSHRAREFRSQHRSPSVQSEGRPPKK
ncbi:hypothetical protein U1Q18_007496 [Sarracenia purpurea var. burkii]